MHSNGLMERSAISLLHSRVHCSSSRFSCRTKWSTVTPQQRVPLSVASFSLLASYFLVFAYYILKDYKIQPTRSTFRGEPKLETFHRTHSLLHRRSSIWRENIREFLDAAESVVCNIASGLASTSREKERPLTERGARGCAMYRDGELAVVQWMF